jgi:4-amino-4-deoxy-L-arabinose transferase-like glycosyltransferase
VVVAVVALVARTAPVLRGGGLTGVLAYDDGVYYSASDALLSGRLPYRDYLLLHPPGITLVLAPFAALGRWLGDPVGLATGRVAFMLVGTLSAVLVWWLARRVVSPRAGLVAGLVYAVWQPASYAERTTLLEPLVNLGVLASLALLSSAAGRRRLVAAGAVLGLAVAVKAWAVVPFAVLAVWVWHRWGPRAGLRYVGAGAAAGAVVCLPFLLAGGPAMLRMVVLDQLGRPNNGVGLLSRLASIESLQLSPGPVDGRLAVVTELVAVAIAAAVALLAWRRPATRLWACLFAVAMALLLTSPSYFAHYGTFAAPSLALLAGAGADAVLAWVSVRAPALRPVAPAVGLVALAALGAHVVTQSEGRAVPVQAVTVALSSTRCVAADSAAALVVADVLTRDLRNGCPVVVDVTGLTYDQDPGDLHAGPTPRARRQDGEWQRGVDRYLSGADAVVLDQWRTDGLDAGELGRLEQHDLELGRPSYRVLVPAT